MYYLLTARQRVRSNRPPSRYVLVISQCYAQLCEDHKTTLAILG